MVCRQITNKALSKQPAAHKLEVVNNLSQLLVVNCL